MVTFQSKVEQFSDSGVWSHFFRVEASIAQQFIEGKNRRVVCSVNGSKTFQCALMHGSDDLYFINLNKELRKQLALKEGEHINVILEKDTSEFGLPFPEEFKEVLDTDEKARQHFDSLTAGKKRNLLYIVNKPKSTDKKIEKAIVIAEHLKKMNGKIDFKILNEDFKNYRF